MWRPTLAIPALERWKQKNWKSKAMSCHKLCSNLTYAMWDTVTKGGGGAHLLLWLALEKINWLWNVSAKWSSLQLMRHSLTLFSSQQTVPFPEQTIVAWLTKIPGFSHCLKQPFNDSQPKLDKWDCRGDLNGDPKLLSHPATVTLTT